MHVSTSGSAAMGDARDDDDTFERGTLDRLAHIDDWMTRQTASVTKDLTEFKHALKELADRMTALESQVQSITARDMPALRGRTRELRGGIDFLQNTLVHVMNIAAASCRLFTDEHWDDGFQWAAPPVMMPRNDSSASIARPRCSEQ